MNYKGLYNAAKKFAQAQTVKYCHDNNNENPSMCKTESKGYALLRIMCLT